MPKGLKRYYGAGDAHFITCSCYQRRKLLNTPDRRDLFLETLEQVRQRYTFVVLGYVVMPEHFHLLMSEPETGSPSTVMQVLKQRFARQVPGCTSAGEMMEKSRVWQERFYDFNVWSEGKRIERLRYMHLNPVKRGLVAAPEEWLWSSFRDYFGEQPGKVRVSNLSVLTRKILTPVA